MGVSLNYLVPREVSVSTLSTAIGILSGLPVRRTIHSNGAQPFAVCEVDGVDFSSSVLGLITVHLDHPTGVLVDGLTGHSFNYDCDTSGSVLPNYACVTVHSTPYWCAIMDTVARLFGGLVCFNDCSDVAFNRAYPSRFGSVGRDENFSAIQEALFSLSPLDDFVLSDYAKVAAYES